MLLRYIAGERKYWNVVNVPSECVHYFVKTVYLGKLQYYQNLIKG